MVVSRQDEAEFVIDLDRGFAETMPDAGPLDPGCELAADLLGELGSDPVGPCCTDRSLGGEDWTVYQGPVPDPGQPRCRSKRTKIAVITSRSSGTE